MKKLKPGIYSHRVSGQQAIVYEGNYHEYAGGIMPEPHFEDYNSYGVPHIAGFPIAYGTLEENPEIWEWVCEL